MKLLKLWSRWFNLWWQYEMAYRLNFILRCTGLVFYNFIGPLLAIVIYSISSGFPGWSFEQFLLIQGIMMTVLGIAHLLFTNAPWIISDLVRNGELDNLFIRPISPLRLLFCWAVDPEHIPQLCAGALIAVYAAIKAGVEATGVVNCIILILAALAILAAFMIILSALTIFTVKANALIDFFLRIIAFGNYPLTIYGPIGAFLFTFILPVGIIAYYPAQALLGQISLRILIELISAAIIFFSLSLAIWRLAIKKYTSAGG